MVNREELDALINLQIDVKGNIMGNLLIFILLATVSVLAMADHHRGDHHSMGAQGKGMFERADLDGDGSISVAEHEEALSDMLDRRRQRFSEMDTDGNGSLSRDEAQAAKHRSRGEHKAKEGKHHENKYENQDRLEP